MRYFSSIILILILACNQKSSKERSLSSLHLIDSVYFPIDNQTAHYYRTFQINKVDDQHLLHFFNNSNKSIYIYDFDERKLIDTIALRKDGPNGVGELSSIDVTFSSNYLYVLNSDFQRLFKFDKKGTLLGKLNLDSLRDKMGLKMGYAEAQSNRPIVVVNDTTLLLHTMMFGTKDNIRDYYALWKVVFGTNKQHVEGVAKFPPIYNEGNYGNMLHYYASFCLYKNTGLIGGFAHDDTLRSYSIESTEEMNSFECVSDAFSFKGKENAPLAKDLRGISKTDEEKTLYEFTTPYYHKVFYDDLSDNFIRLAVSHVPSKQDVKLNGGDFRKGMGLSLMVYDNKYQKVGEWKLPQDVYQIGCAFFLNGRLYILPKAKFQEYEDSLKFHVYTYPY